MVHQKPRRRNVNAFKKPGPRFTRDGAEEKIMKEVYGQEGIAVHRERLAMAQNQTVGEDWEDFWGLAQDRVTELLKVLQDEDFIPAW